MDVTFPSELGVQFLPEQKLDMPGLMLDHCVPVAVISLLEEIELVSIAKYSSMKIVLLPTDDESGLSPVERKYNMIFVAAVGEQC